MDGLITIVTMNTIIDVAPKNDLTFLRHLSLTQAYFGNNQWESGQHNHLKRYTYFVISFFTTNLLQRVCCIKTKFLYKRIHMDGLNADNISYTN